MELISLIILGAIALLILIILLIKFPKDLVGALALVVFFLPFERIPTLAVGDFTLKINHILGLLLIIFWFLDRTIYRKIKFQPNPIALLLWLLVGAIILSAVDAIFRTRAIIYGAQAIFTILLAVATIDIIRSQRDLARIEKFLMMSAWVVVLFCFWQFLGDFIGLKASLTGLDPGYSKAIFGFPRIQAFSREPLYLGNYLFIPLGFLTAYILNGTATKSNKLLFFLIIVCFFLTLSRGALLGLAVFAILLALLWARKIFTINNFFAVSLGLVLIIGVVAAGLTLYGNGGLQKYINQLAVKDLGVSESTVSRLSSVSEAIIDWQAHPIIGIGMGNFGGSQNGYDSYDLRTRNIVNNEFAELLAETGIIGFISFVLLLVMVLARSFYVVNHARDKKLVALTLTITVAFIGMLVQYNFFSTLSIIHIWVMIGLIVAIQTLALNPKVAR